MATRYTCTPVSMAGPLSLKRLRESGISEQAYIEACRVCAERGWDLNFVPRRGFRLFGWDEHTPQVGSGGVTETCWLGMGEVERLVADPTGWLNSRRGEDMMLEVA